MTYLVELRADLLEGANPADLGRGRHLGIHVHVLIVRPRGLESTTQLIYTVLCLIRLITTHSTSILPDVYCLYGLFTVSDRESEKKPFV